MEVSLKTLIESGAHFGHQARRWNPKMRDFIYGEKDGVHIFDLTKTKVALEEALEALKKASSEGKIILFLGTKKQAKDKVAETAKAAGVYYINERWLGGTFTNFDQIRKSVKKMAEIRKGLETGEYNDRTKKERLLIEREKQRLERFFGGLEGLEKPPEVLIVIDVKREKTSIHEAGRKGVKVIAVVDSNGDPAGINYPIPMNDDASKALDYVLGLMKEAILTGKGKKVVGSEKSEVGKKTKS